MLKKICKLLVLGMVVCAGSACVTPTHASSAYGVLISHVYPGVGGASNELIALFNNTEESVDITGWCLANSAGKNIHCFDERSSQYLIEPYSYLVAVSASYAASNTEAGLFDVIYEPLNKVSGSLVGKVDTVYVKDALGGDITSWGWTKTLSDGRGFIRSGFIEEVGLYNELSAIEVALIEQVAGGGMVKQFTEEDRIRYEDFIHLSEVLPNPKGADVGNEFIEIVNWSEAEVPLENFAVRVIGGSSSKTYPLTTADTMTPGEYKALFDTDTKLSMNNTAGTVQLLYSISGLPLDYDVIDEAIYNKPPEAWSWAYFDEPGWEYTYEPTPGLENKKEIFVDVVPVALDVPKPCSPDQFRNPITGRCKKIAADTAPVPCKLGQYRSAETGRCRNNAAATGPAPCKPGQERNLETNRCRNIVKMTKVSDGVMPKETSVESGIQWYAWVVVGVIILGVAGYGAWEWRVEIQGLWSKFRKRTSH